jgi:RND family efflux transporter MFP subunit
MKQRIVVVLGSILVIGVAGWYLLKPKDSAGSQAKAPPPAAAVSTVRAAQMNVPVQLVANGYVSSLNSVEVRPQVSNLLAKVHIREGQFVKAGDLLFSLDDRADRVNLEKVQAQLAKDRAALADAERQLARSRELLAKGFIAQSAVDTVQTQMEAARATLAADTAAVNAVKVSLGYATIRASTAGRAGAISVFPGSLVQPSSPPLVVISQIDPIAVTFTLPETELAALLAAQKQGPVKVAASAQQGTPLNGQISFVDNAVDPQNGTIKVKAVFPNPEHALWPGQYVAVNTIVRELKDAIVVPQAAIITGLDNKTVYAVGPDQTVQARPVKVVYGFGTQAAVTGLQAGDSVVVDGKQNLRPGAKVREANPSVATDGGKHDNSAGKSGGKGGNQEPRSASATAPKGQP